VKSLTATGALVRLALRRDRVKSPVWILAIVAFVAANIPAVIDFYGTTYQKQLTYAASTSTSVISRVFNGPIHGPELGEIVMNETFLFTAITVAFMSTLSIVRHTRQNEETGRAELIDSAVVGRYASLTAALLVTAGADSVLGILVALVYRANGLPAASSVAAGVALTATGLVFAGIAAIVAQVSDSARGANSLSAIVIGIGFLLRGVGDGVGRIVDGGLGVASAWPSWLSPFGWGQQMYVFSEQRFWVFGLFAGLFAACTGTAYALNVHRDLGLGMIPARRGPAHAVRSLLSPLGLAWRLQRGTLRGWAVGIAVMGVSCGFIADEFKDLLGDNEQVADFFKQLDSDVSFSDFFFAAIIGLMAVAIGGYVVQALLRMRSEEAAGHLEPVLATGVSRPRWMLSHVSIALFGTVLLLVIMGATTGIAYVFVAHVAWSEVLRLTGASLIHVPAASVLAGFAVLVFALRPRWAVAVTWSAFAICFLTAEFGQVLKVPQWLMNISPFSHTPAAPAADVRFQPLLILAAIALGLMVAGMMAFRRRDVTTA